MYTLYGTHGGGANMVCHAGLIAIGEPFEFVEVDPAKGQLTSPDYLKLNPHARVPTLVHEGKVIYESAAILLYLCERHPEAQLMPAVNSPTRGLFLQWLFYLTNTVQEELNRWWHSEQYVEGEEHRRALVEGTERRLARMWRHLDGVLADGGPYLLGDVRSAPDLFLVMLMRWSRNTAEPARSFPHLAQLADLIETWVPYRRMMDEEGIS